MRQFLERLSLAIRIIFDRDSSIVAHARREAQLVDSSIVQHLVDVVRVFSLEGHSGASASIVIPWIEKVLSWKPIAPLTGAADEWNDVSAMSGRPLWQNKRCSRVFKEGDGRCFDVKGIVFVEDGGASYTNHESATPVTFPYTPTTRYETRRAD